MLPPWLTKALGAVLCVHLGTAFAAPAPPAWMHQAWQLPDGLPNNYVVGTARTSDGYLWVGTRTHLARFDGTRFETIPTTDFWNGTPQGLRLVLPSAAGGLWIGLDNGILLHLKDGEVRPVLSEPLNLVPLSLVEESRDVLWVTYRKGILYRIAAGRAELVGAEQGLPAGTVCSVARDAAGEIWCARGRSLGRLRGKRFESVCALESREAVLCAARGGGLWIYSNGKLLRFSPAKGLTEVGALEAGHSALTPLLLLEDRSGAVWLGTYESGLLRFGDGRVDAITTSDRQIESLAEERDGSIWVGTAGGGLNRISRQAISRETDDTGAVVNALSLCEDTSGVIWAAGINGDLLRRNDAGWQPIESTEQTVWRTRWVSAVGADRDGAIWIGTHHQSVHRLNNGQLTTFNHAAGIRSQWINCLLVSRSGGLWVAGEKPDALQHLEHGRFVSLPLPPDVHSIRALTEDAAGDIWVGGRTADNRGVVLRVSGARITNESENPLAPPRPIRSTCRTDDGDLWMGAPGDQGLVRLRQGRFAVVGREQGLFDCALSQVVADRQGWIWCVADHGVFKVRQQEFDAVAAGQAAEVHSVRYNVGAGFGGPQGMASVSPGALCDREGRVWIPMRSALLRVDPELLPHEDQPPAVHLERVSVDHEVIASYGGPIPAHAADL
jgi:ligand-binding sensor domain-containing protein